MTAGSAKLVASGIHMVIRAGAVAHTSDNHATFLELINFWLEKPGEVACPTCGLYHVRDRVCNGTP